MTSGHGWEPEDPVDDTLLRRWISNFVTSWEVPVLAMGGTVQRNEDAALMLVGRPAGLFNGAILTRPPVYGDPMATYAILADALSGLSGAEIWSAWPLGNTGPPDWVEHFFSPLMYLPSLDQEPPLVDGAVVRQVESIASASVFFDILARGFDVPDLLEHPPVLDEQILDTDRFRMFLGYFEGEPVAISAAVLDAGLNGVTYVATLPGYRRKGLGALMTWAATATWSEYPAALVATSEGRSVYERLGYLAVSQFSVLKRAV